MTDCRARKPAARQACGRSRGLTLLELLVALAIAALLTAAGVPALRDYLQNQRMKSALWALHADLVRARNEAVHHAGSTVVCPGDAARGCLDGTTWEYGWLVFRDEDGDRERGAGEPVLRQAPAVEFLRISSAASRRRLRFDATGAAPASNATFVFCDDRGPAAARQLKLANTGRIRHLRPGEDPPDAC